MAFPKINFSWLAHISAGRAPILRGLLPPLGTIAALLGVALMISGAWWLIAGAQAASALFLPFYLKTFVAVCGVTILNFVFQREIRYALKSCRSIEDNYLYDPENPTDVQKMVNALTAEENKFFREKFGDSHMDMPVPRLATFKEGHSAMETVSGMNPWHSAILFSHEFFWEHHTFLNQREQAAITAKQLAKIYMRRDSAHLIVRMGLDMVETLQSLKEANSFFKLLGLFTWPLKFLFLVERALQRTREYEASKMVAEMGRGYDLYVFYDKDPSPTLYKKPDDIHGQRERKKRPPYEGPLKWLVGPIHRWIVDNLELPNEHHENNIILVAMGGIVREGIFYLNELDSPNPRGTNEKTELLSALNRVHKAKIEAMGKENFAALEFGAQLKLFEAWDKELNRNFEPAEDLRYAPISPNGDGYARPFGRHRHAHHDDHHGAPQPSVDELLSQTGQATTPLADLRKDSAGQVDVPSDEQTQAAQLGSQAAKASDDDHHKKGGATLH